VFDFRSKDAKEQLYKQKEKDWLPFGYTQEYLDEMRSQEFWELEFNKIAYYDSEIKKLRSE
jgi:cysteine synthase